MINEFDFVSVLEGWEKIVCFFLFSNESDHKGFHEIILNIWKRKMHTVSFACIYVYIYCTYEKELIFVIVFYDII